MKYLLILIIFLFFVGLTFYFTTKKIDNRRKRFWFQFIIFDLLFALASLCVYYVSEAVWYVTIGIIFLNLICIYLSGWYLFNKVIFIRRNKEYEKL